MHKRVCSIASIMALLLFMNCSGIYASSSGSEMQDYSYSYSGDSNIRNVLNERCMAKTLGEQSGDSSSYVTLSLDAMLPVEEARIFRYEFYASYPELSLAYSPRVALQAYSKNAEVTTSYRMTRLSAYGGDARYEELEAATSAIIELLQDAPDYVKIWAVSKWMASRCSYTGTVTNMWDECLYGSLVKGTATCLGFSEGFYFMMKKLHVPCRIVANDVHAWNEVMVDGKWKTVDITKML